MAQPAESDSKGKSVVASSEEPTVEFKCPRCEKTFHSGPALCGHQNAHRLVKEPMKMSPVPNNPLPPDDKPVLIPAAPKPGPNPRRVKQIVSKYPCAGTVFPRCHPYRRLIKEPVQVHLDEEEEVNSYDIIPNKEPDEGMDFLRQLEEKEPHYHPYEMVVPEYNEENSLLQYLTMDLLGEWMPISSFGDHGHLGTSSGGILSDPAILRNYPMEEAGEAGLQTGSKTSTGHLDLELKLGF